MKVTTIVIQMAMMLALMTMGSGCMSYWSMECSKTEITKERVYASGNQKAINLVNAGADADVAIRAVALDNGGAGIGLDISNLSALSKHPMRQIGAAVVDAGMLYGTYAGLKSLNDSSSHDSTTTVGGDQVIVNGDGNTTTTGSPTSTDNSSAK